MSISDYHRDELIIRRLNEEAKRLKGYHEAQSEAVKIEFRHRYDEAVAVLQPMKDVWVRIDEVEAELEKNRRSKWRRVLVGIFSVSGVVSFWPSPDENVPYKVDEFLVLSSALGYALFELQVWYLTRELTRLTGRQDDYLYRWEAAGARASEFWAYRNRIRDEIKREALPELERDEADKELEASWYVLQHRLRQSLFSRASGMREEYYPEENGEYVLREDPW